MRLILVVLSLGLGRGFTLSSVEGFAMSERERIEWVNWQPARVLQAGGEAEVVKNDGKTLKGKSREIFEPVGGSRTLHLAL